MDRKSIVILVVCAGLFVVWAQMMQRLYPPQPAPRTNTTALASNTAGASAGAQQLESPSPATSPKPSAPEEVLVLTNEIARYTFTSHGGGLKLVELLKYPDSVSCN